MTPKVWIKHPLAKWYVSFNAVKALATGDAVLSVKIKIFDEGATDVSASMIAGSPVIISPEIFVWVQAGQDLKNYLLQLVATTGQGEIIPDELLIHVRDTPIS